MTDGFEYKIIHPALSLSPFIEGFWMLADHSGSDRDIVILPDGLIDLFFSQSAVEPFHTTLSGLETKPSRAVLSSGTRMFAISFKLLSVEYILRNTISHLIDYATLLPDGFWDFHANDLLDFDLFCNKASQKLLSLLPEEVDNRKFRLFELIHATNGAISVQELSDAVFWSSRQINRYFNQQFGLSLKTYCSILRFRASFAHIKEGKLFPEQNFADQSHFIKAVKKLSGVSPKILKHNRNDRFIQFSTLRSI